MPGIELNLDGLVGPTHNYAGLSSGNIASQRHRLEVSHPRAAALQGLAKMKLLAELGVAQAVLPPQDRPDVETLRRLGFSGSDAQVLFKARDEAPQLLAMCASASAMWAANAATVSPSADTGDGRVHFTTANLANNLHRAIEPPMTAALLRAIFPDQSVFVHHPPLQAGGVLYDEGAANHTRLAAAYDAPGVEMFTYGRQATVTPGSGTTPLPGAGAGAGATRFPARQTLEASQTIARLHQLDPQRTLCVRQNPAAIDAGVFHNDVIAVGNLNVLLCHGQAWVDQAAALVDLRRRVRVACGTELAVIEVGPEEVSLQDAVDTYLFNSQLITLPGGDMALICPAECQRQTSTRAFLDSLLLRQDQPIRRIIYADVRQSMMNGGGPACLRLRVALTDDQLTRVLPTARWSPTLHESLSAWVQRHYRSELRPDDLADPKLLEEGRAALDELTGLLGLGTIYEFQR